MGYEEWKYSIVENVENKDDETLRYNGRDERGGKVKCRDSVVREVVTEAEES